MLPLLPLSLLWLSLVRCRAQTSISEPEVITLQTATYQSLVDNLDGETTLTNFTTDLKTSLPQDAFKQGDNFTVFAPTNDAYVRYRTGEVAGALPGTSLSQRSSQPVTPAVSLSFVNRAGTSLNLAYNPATLRTNLTDPQYVNLGPNVPANIVSEPDPASGRKYIYLTTGLGRRSRVQLGGSIQFDGGEIIPSDDVLTLPQPFDATLRETNGSRFLQALEQASLLSTITNTPQITAFVPVDKAFSGFKGADLTPALLRRHVWRGSLGYTPDLIVGKAQETMDGSRVTITYRKDAAAYFVGDARVVMANVITKNGVIHYIDQFIAPPSESERGRGPGADGDGASVKASVATGKLYAPVMRTKVVVASVGVVFLARWIEVLA